MKNLFKAAVCIFLMITLVIPTIALNASAASPKISRTSANVPIGYSVTVKVTGASSVKWSSSDESVAAVKADGTSAKIVGKKAGTATISAKVGSTTLKCKVTVKKSFITASSEKVTLEKGKSKTITLKVTGSKDIALTNSDKSVCSTSWGKWDGNTIKLTIKAKAAGSATIKVYAKQYSKSTAQEIVVNVGGITEDSDITGSSAEEQVIELVNKERKAAGKSTVKMDDDLNKIAALRAKEIAKEFSHTRPDGSSCFTAVTDAGYKNFSTLAENIAYNYSSSADDVMEQWMNSSGHKANILNSDMTKMGVGCYESGGKYYWVQVFAG